LTIFDTSSNLDSGIKDRNLDADSIAAVLLEVLVNVTCTWTQQCVVWWCDC